MKSPSVINEIFTKVLCFYYLKISIYIIYIYIFIFLIFFYKPFNFIAIYITTKQIKIKINFLQDSSTVFNTLFKNTNKCLPAE